MEMQGIKGFVGREYSSGLGQNLSSVIKINKGHLKNWRKEGFFFSFSLKIAHGTISSNHNFKWIQKENLMNILCIFICIGFFFLSCISAYYLDVIKQVWSIELKKIEIFSAGCETGGFKKKSRGFKKKSRQHVQNVLTT